MLSPSQARIQSIRVTPSLPEALTPLMTIAQNLWWTWNYEAVDLFAKLDRELWEQCHHNPVAMLGKIGQERLDRAANDRSFLHALGAVQSQLQEHMQSQGWRGPAGQKGAKDGRPMRVAYFCAEFGLTECLQIYSGGLGGLAGDHLKSAAELGIPLVAVGMLYRKGYFHQYLNPDGFQQETYPDIDAANQPLCRVMDEKTGQQKRVIVELPGRQVAVGIWRCDVGRVPLYLLDTNLPENSREDRDITSNLYTGDAEARMRQEMVLGIGGVRALRAVGEEPTVVHINEGHAAFCSLERIAQARREHPHLTFDQAREAVAAGQVFTTHTPVPAGIDRFAPRLIESYLGHMLGPIGLDLEGLLALGRENTADQKEFFSMAVLAIRTSRFCNGVSRLHGQVSRGMWQHMWPGTPEPDVPIGHVTNGVHARSWVSGEMTRLYNRYLTDRWRIEPHEPATWEAINEVPDEELWGVRCYRRERLIAWTRRKIREQLISRGAGALEIERASAALDLNALTIGFARRFATYKRAGLLFRDPERLRRLLTGDRPVQLIIAGKAHPADGGGKQLIREIVSFIRTSGLGHRIVFLEDYDMLAARRMVQGCDVWLNTPIRGLEASGTSGMKAALNGGLHCSILDGWWAEAFDPEVGFAVGRGEDYEEATREEQDDIESRSLYQLLESRVIPEFYDRDESGLPRKWIGRVKRSIKSLGPRFNTHRMVTDYAEQYYMPAHAAAMRLAQDRMREAKELADHLDRLRAHWGGVQVVDVKGAVSGGASVSVRSSVKVTATVRLGELRPDEVEVQLYHGTVTSLGELTRARAMTMKHEADAGEGVHRFAGQFAPGASGQHGFSVRVLPRDERLVTPFVPGLITWDTGQEEAATVMAGA